MDLERRSEADELETAGPVLEAPGASGRLDELLDATRTLVAFTRGPEHVLDEANAPFLETLGVAGEEALGRPLRELLDGDRLVWLELFDRVTADGVVLAGADLPAWERSPGDGLGRPASFHLTLRPWRDREGAVLGVGFLGVDASDAVRSRARLVELESALADADARAIAQGVIGREGFLATVSHDLRNPLNVLFMTSELLLRNSAGDASDRMRKHVEAMQRAGEHMLHVLEGLLELVRLEAARVPLDVRPHEVAPLLAETTELMQPLAEKRSIRLDVELARWGLRVLCDRTRAERALGNVVDNAIRFSPPGTPVVVRAEPVGGEVRFAVIDRGPGIPQEQLRQILAPYWRERPGRHRRTGLGLAIARALAEAMGGRLEAESRPGVGSTFSLVLRAAS